MIRLLLDQGCPGSAAALLQDKGFDAVHSADMGLSMATDIHVPDQARREHRGIVALAADFHALLAVSGTFEQSLLRMRREGLRGPELADLIREVLKWVGPDWLRRVLATATNPTVRMRRFPVLPTRGLDCRYAIYG